jgi:flagellar hook-length control protein FliK
MLLDTATSRPEPPPRDNAAAARPAAADRPATAAAPDKAPPAKAPSANDAGSTSNAVTNSDAPPTDACAKAECKLPLDFIKAAIAIETPEDAKAADAVPTASDTLPDVDAPSDTLTALPEPAQPVVVPIPTPAQIPAAVQVQVEALETPDAVAIEGMQAAAQPPKTDPLKAAAPEPDAPAADTDPRQPDLPNAHATKAAPPATHPLNANPLKAADTADAIPQVGSKPAGDAEAAADQVAAPPVQPRLAKAAPNAVAAEHHAAEHHPAEPPAPAPHAGEAAVRVVDAIQSLGLAPAAHVTTSQPQHVAAPAALAAATPDAATVPVAGLAVAIAAQAQAGKSRFEIRLDPPELGRIDVRLDIDRDGNVASRLVVERQDTLDLLRRDASQLERALQQAGLKTADNALEFSLRGHAFGRDQETPDAPARLVIPEDDAAPLEALRNGYGRILGLGGGIDIRV